MKEEQRLDSQKYTISDVKIATILTWIEEDKIGIPEIQRPFVWESTDVTSLIESLYKGLPIGYFVTWKDTDVKLKDGGISIGKTILIDGQQRVKALMSSLLGKEFIAFDGWCVEMLSVRVTTRTCSSHLQSILLSFEV